MNKILMLAICVAISYPSHAWESFSQDELLLITRPNGDTEKLAFGELEEEIANESPSLYEWCTQKTELAVGMLNDRRLTTKDDITEEVRPLETSLPRYMWIDVLRIISDIYRYNSKGNFIIGDTLEEGQALVTKEYQKCLINGF